MMLEYSDVTPVWYSLHMMQSVSTSATYFKEIRSWLDTHPQEIVVMWLSKHGSACATGEEQYPHVSVEQKQTFFKEILDIFNGVVVDYSITKLNETTINTMLERNHRVVLYTSDYVEVTGYSSDVIASGTSYYALNGCDVDNDLGNPGSSDIVNTVTWQKSMFAAANERKAVDKTQQKFYLVSYAGASPQSIPLATMKFGVFGKIPATDAELTAQCAAVYNIPGMTWCPETLLDTSQLSNYYSQIAMEELIQTMLQSNNTYGLPNGIYINAVDSLDGTIRTGTQVLWGKNRSPDTTHATQGFCYVDSFVLYNVLNVCNAMARPSADCIKYRDLLIQRRAKNPITLWDDAAFGRLSNWI